MTENRNRSEGEERTEFETTDLSSLLPVIPSQIPYHLRLTRVRAKLRPFSESPKGIALLYNSDHNSEILQVLIS